MCIHIMIFKTAIFATCKLPYDKLIPSLYDIALYHHRIHWECINQQNQNDTHTPTRLVILIKFLDSFFALHLVSFCEKWKVLTTINWHSFHRKCCDKRDIKFARHFSKNFIFLIHFAHRETILHQCRPFQLAACLHVYPQKKFLCIIENYQISLSVSSNFIFFLT